MKTETDFIGTDVPWQKITPGGAVYSGGNSSGFRTGDWSSIKPFLDKEKCRNCHLCVPVCPDSVITAGDDIPEFNLNLCKGCGICVEACSFSALSMKKEEI